MAKKILVVDDDPNIRETAKDILEDAGYQVEAVGTSAEAITRLEAGSVDLAIIDFNLPDGTGVDLALKAKAICPAVTIFLLTGEGNVELGAAQTAISAILTKPVSPSLLIELLQQNS